MNNSPGFNWPSDTVLEHMSDGFVSIDMEWRIRYANPAIETFFHMKAANLVGQYLWSLLPHTVLPLFQKNVERAVESGQATCFQTSAGPERRWHTYLYPFTGGLSILIHDSTSRFRVKEMIQASYGHLASWAQAAEQAVFETESVTMIERLLAALTEHLGLDICVSHILHKPTGKLRLAHAHGLAQAGRKTLLWVDLGQNACGAVAQTQRELVVEHIDGASKSDANLAVWKQDGVLALICQPLIAHGKLLGTLSFGSRARPSFTILQLELIRLIGRHMTESLDRAMLDAKCTIQAYELADKLQELASKEENFAREMMRLDRLNMVGEMAAGIGHEVRNPLTTVRGLLQLMEQRSDPANKAHYRLMISEIDRANAIITEYLSLAKHTVVNPQPHNLNDLLCDLHPLVQADATIGNKQVRLELEPVPDLLLDSGQIRQMLLNLIRNALESMTTGGEVSLHTLHDDKQVTLLVRDRGGGIPDRVMESLGTPFVTTKENGTGLGLAICFTVARNHNASMQVETGPSGTTFRICFPISTS